MGYLISLSVLLILMGGFIVLTALEAKSGVRLLSGARRAFDRQTARTAFIIRHVDWSGVARHMLRVLGERIAHDVAHATLIVVRFLERFLTQAVRSLRARRAGRAGLTDAPSSNVVVEAITHARQNLRQRRRREKVLGAPSKEGSEE